MRVYLIIRAKVVSLRRFLWAYPSKTRFFNNQNYTYHEKIILTYSRISASISH